MPWGLRHEVFHDQYVGRCNVKEDAIASDTTLQTSKIEHAISSSASIAPATHIPDLLSRVTALEEELIWIKQIMHTNHQEALAHKKHQEIAQNTTCGDS